MKTSDGSKGQTMHLVIASDLLAVRTALENVLASPPMRDMNDDARGTAEIVLAEVLNNIVEHAYADAKGEIQVSLHPKPDGVFVAVSDQGRALPNEALPQGNPPQSDSDLGLPEGGFGWFLIRSLVQSLSYQRKGANNHLTFLLPVEAEPDKVH